VRRARASTLLDPTIVGTALDDAVQKGAGCETVVVAAFASVAAYRGTAALAGEYPRMMEGLLAGGKRVVFVALGNPYLLRAFPKVNAYLATFSTVPPSEVAAVRALFGEIAIRGRLPVSIPGVAAYGEGILLPARSMP